MSLKSDTQGFDISKNSAAVIGCGGLGSNVCVHLAGAGIGKLVICDYDTVSESNLNRQFMYKKSDIGRLKTEAAAEFLSNYAPDCEITAVTRRITDASSLDFAAECAIIVIAADNTEVRKTVYDFCHEHGIPLVNGGINGASGNCCLCIPGVTPCLDCMGALCASGQIKNVSSTAGVIGALEASLAQRCLLGDKSLAGTLLVYDGEEITHLAVKPQADCICNKITGGKTV